MAAPARPITGSAVPFAASSTIGRCRASCAVRARTVRPRAAANPQRLKPRLADADKVGTSICAYCAVGCAQLVYAKDGKVIHVEGDPRSPINQGTLCPKGAATLDLLNSPLRLNHVLYRAPGSDHWEQKPLDWAMDRIAQLVKQTRDETFVQKLPNGTTVNHTLAIGSLGGATLDNEENYLIKKLLRRRPRHGLDREPGARLPQASVPSLGATYGRGAATLPQWDLANSDCVVVMGSNMAENHPIAFRFVVKAKEKGATVIHVDPRFTRTSALADIYAPIRTGTDIAFLGGIIHYLLENDLWFKEYALDYTNLATIIDERFQDADELDGLFSGWNEDKGAYHYECWQYKGEAVPSSLAEHSVNTTESFSEKTKRMDQGAAAAGPDAAASELRLPDHAPPLRPLHARDGRARHRLPEGDLHQGRRSAGAEFRPRAHRRLLLRGGLDPPHHRRADHPRRRHHPGPARQCRPARRRHPGAARPLQHPGQRPTCRRSTTCCRPTCRSRRPTRRTTRFDDSSSPSARRPAGGTTSPNTP